MAPRQIIIDCDPGQDDAIAILLALASPEELEVLAVTVVAGNVGLDRTTGNARRIVELAGFPQIRVHAGCDRPLLRPLETADHVHGESGLNQCVLPEPAQPAAPGHAANVIVEEVMRRPPGTVTLCPLGPLTNVALALRLEPRLAQHLAGIVLMGGAIGLGNMTPAAEYNIYVDPHAARIVFESGADIVMLGLDVTHKALVTDKDLEELAALGTAVGQACVGLLDFRGRYDQERHGGPAAPLHDPCVIAYLLRPDLFGGRRCRVEIETESRHSMGRTIVDWWRCLDAPSNALVIDEIDAPGFLTLVKDRLARL